MRAVSSLSTRTPVTFLLPEMMLDHPMTSIEYGISTGLLRPLLFLKTQQKLPFPPVGSTALWLSMMMLFFKLTRNYGEGVRTTCLTATASLTADPLIIKFVGGKTAWWPCCDDALRLVAFLFASTTHEGDSGLLATFAYLKYRKRTRNVHSNGHNSLVPSSAMNEAMRPRRWWPHTSTGNDHQRRILI